VTGLDYDDPTPAGVTREIWRWFPAWVNALIVIAVLGAALTYAGHAFGWWLSAQDATHQAQSTQNGYANQTTLRQEVTRDFTTLTSIGVQIAGAAGDPSMVTELKTEQAATADKVCAEAAQVSGTPLPAQQAAWADRNCTAGTLSPGSPDFIPGAP
jgi:hypothetical protein